MNQEIEELFLKRMVRVHLVRKLCARRNSPTCYDAASAQVSFVLLTPSSTVAIHSAKFAY